MKKYIYIIIGVVLLPLTALAQTDRQLIRQGNRLFHAQQYDKAEGAYRKACAANPKNPEAQYNLGCALLAQQKDSAAVSCFENGAKLQPDKERRAQAYHNMGVICQGKKMWGEAIEAYKQALRCNPKDNETRYNLALCLKQKKNDDKNKNQNKDKNKDQNKDQNKDKNKDQNKDQNQNKDQDKDKNQDKQNQNQQQQEKMSKDNAEQLLNAAVQQEKATQQKLKKAQAQPRQNRHQKNW